jgi:anti-sigma factor RsiW
MNCAEVRFLLGSYSDGELDLVSHAQIEMHLDECCFCKQMHTHHESVRSALSDESLRYRAPAALRERVLGSLDPAEKGGLRWWPKPAWFSWAAATVLATLVITSTLLYFPWRANDHLLAQELVSSHVRSMMADHITDVPSSDQHTVKPWFDGKLDFAPPVVDLGPEGFVLVGGRLDYVADRPVAALVYKRRQHVINLFVLPDEDPSSVKMRSLDRQGYNLVGWSRSGMTFWAVSDLNSDELRQFSQLYQN